MGMSLHGLVHFIRRWWLLLVIVPLVTGALAYAFGTTRTPMYASSSTLLVSIPPSSALDGYTANLLAQDLSITYQALVSTDPVLGPVAAAADPPMTAEQLHNHTTVSASSGALFTVTVVDPDPDRAAALVNALTTRFTAFVTDLSGSADGDGDQPGTVTTVVTGAVPDAPYAPRLPAYAALGVVAGLVLVNLGLILFERLDTRVRTMPDLAGISPLARIPTVGKRLAGPASLFLDQPQGAAAGEEIRALRTAVMATHDAPGSVLVVSSPNREDGKTIVAANLATALASAGKLVMLVDANLRAPRLHEIFQLNNVHGLGTLLSAPDLSWKSSAIRIAPNLAVIPAGTVRDHPADLLAKPAFGTLLEELSATADIVIIDTPSVDLGNDALTVAMHARSVLLLCRSGNTHRDVLDATSNAFLDMGADVLGVVMNEGGSGWNRTQLRRVAGRHLQPQSASGNGIRPDASHATESA